MAYDTVKLCSPALDRSLMDRIRLKCIQRSGVHMESGEVLYELFSGELLGSWDARIAVRPKDEKHQVDGKGIVRLQPCEPFLEVEASVHKVVLGHNVYGGPSVFLDACRNLVAIVEQLLETQLPHADVWTVHRVDVAVNFRLRKEACLEFFAGVQLKSFPRRKKKAVRFNTGIYFPGKTTTVKFYHKGSEFQAHELSRMRGFLHVLFAHLYGRSDERQFFKRIERKLTAIQRLADARLRAEVEIHSDKFQYDYGKNPTVGEVSDAYLERVFDVEIERLMREGKADMDKVRESKAVLQRLCSVYGNSPGGRLYGFWTTLVTLGEDVAREQFVRTVFYRNRKQLEDAGVQWWATDVVVVANEGVLPRDFAPVRTDKRLCHLPARNREEFKVSRELMRLAA